MSSTSPSKMCTRYGMTRSPEPQFGGEERFRWQSADNPADVSYKIPELGASKSTVFGTSLRAEAASKNASTTGPGSYNVEKSYNANSEYPFHAAPRFGAAARESMAMKTPSPGAVYDTGKIFKNGPDKNIKISFNCDQRKPLFNPSASANADMLWPVLPKGPSISMAKRLKTRTKGDRTPGAIYNVLNKSSAPSFSFGRSKASRFKDDGVDLSLDP
jgi:hypothetical protein